MKKEIKSVFECATFGEALDKVKEFNDTLSAEERVVAFETKLMFKRCGGTGFVATITTFVGDLPTPMDAE